MRASLAFLALLLATPAAHAQGTVLLEEGFDAGIPATWSVVDAACPATDWHGTSGGFSGNTLDGTEFAFINSDAAGQFCAVEDYLVSPVFDASAATTLKLSYDHYFRFWQTGKGTVQVFDGSAWVDVVAYAYDIGAWGAPHQPVLDLTPWINASMQVRFKYTGNWDWWWALDNVKVYEPLPPPTVYCTAKVNSQGCAPTVAFSGLPSATAATPFVVSAHDVINGKNGLLFYGHSGAQSVPFQGGTLCVQTPVLRTPVQNSAGNPPPDDCSGVLSIDLNAWIQSGADPQLVPGQQVNGQFWYRDPAVAGGSGLSDAIELFVGP